MFNALCYCCCHSPQKLLTTILELTEDDIFLDFGHGIGNACLQAAYTIGCEARGIEVVSDRHFVAQQFSGDLARLNEICLTKDSIVSGVAKIFSAFFFGKKLTYQF